MPEATTRETRVARETAQNPSDEGSDFHLLQGEKSTFDSFKSYGHSHLVTELIFSISVLVIDMMFRAIHPDPRQRNLPYQLLESGEYVVNQVFNEEFLGETVSNRALYVYGAILPFLLQLSLSYFQGVHDLHRTVCVYATGVGLTNLLTNTIKLYVGYLRPIFFDICEPDDTYQYCTSGEDSAARVSFPSGHSSLSFCGLGLLAFYLEQRYGLSKLYEWRVDAVSGQWWKAQTRPVRRERIFSILCYAPFLLAGFIAASRLVDNKHFPADVVGGSVLGASTAKFIHGLWFSDA